MISNPVYTYLPQDTFEDAGTEDVVADEEYGKVRNSTVEWVVLLKQFKLSLLL